VAPTIDRETLNSIAKLNNLRPWQQEKHYLQSLILIILSEYPLAFKGGTYLWFFHRLNRFSEDLDFTATEPLSKELPKKVSENLLLFGVENRTKIITDNPTTLSFRLSARGPLNTGSIDLCHTYVEISRREKLIRRPLSLELSFSAYNLPIKIVSGMSLEEVASEKIRAIMTRDKARDVYDLAFLMEKGIWPALSLVEEKLKYYDLRFSQELFRRKLKAKKKLWKPELAQLVFGPLPTFDKAASKLLKAKFR